jgi:hypothetical protein
VLRDKYSKNPEVVVGGFLLLRGMNTGTQTIIALLQQVFEKDAWHGPSVKEALQAVTARTAMNRLPDTHSIIELVAHMTSWRTFTTRKLEGDNDYRVTDALNFPDAKDWAKALQALEESHIKLLKALEKFPEEKLSETVPDHRTPITP